MAPGIVIPKSMSALNHATTRYLSGSGLPTDSNIGVSLWILIQDRDTRLVVSGDRYVSDLVSFQVIGAARRSCH